MKCIRVVIIVLMSLVIAAVLAATERSSTKFSVVDVIPSTRSAVTDTGKQQTETPKITFEKQSVEEVHGVLLPYDFGYSVQDEYGNSQFRQESSNDQGRVKGSYGYTDAFGLHRRVEYVADENGFRADIKSNEPGVKSDQPANAHFTVEEVPQKVLHPIVGGNNNNNNNNNNSEDDDDHQQNHQRTHDPNPNSETASFNVKSLPFAFSRTHKQN